MDDNLWYERYRPKTLDDIIISDGKKNAVREWFENYQSGDTAQCAMLFIGPPGLGKTSLAHIILNEYGYTVKEFNASDIRSKSLITENLDGLINMTSVKSLGVAKTKPAIIMDEVDGMFKGDRGGVDALLSFISIPSKRKRKNFVNHNRNVPVICICNIGNVKKETINNLKKECFTIEFTLPTPEDIMKVLERVAKNEGMSITDEAKQRIIEYCQTDFRRLICLLEFMDNIYGKVTIDLPELEDCFSIMCLKEQDLYVTDAVKKMINEKLDPYRIQAIYNSDKSKTPMVIHQNYLRAIAGQKQKVEEKLADSISIMESLVISDEVEKIMYNTQNWGLQPVQSLTCAHIPSHYINRKPKQHVIDTKWAGILSVNSQAQNLWKNVNQELNQMCSSKTYSVVDLQHLIEVIFHYLITGRVEEAMMRIARYELCPEFHDHDKRDGKKDRKKALTIIDKLGKYIKISPYYTKWSKFLQKNKNNKDLDGKIYDAYIKHEKRLQTKMTEEYKKRMTSGSRRSAMGRSLACKPSDKRINVKVSPKSKLIPTTKTKVAPKSTTQQKEQIKKRKVSVVLKK